MASADITVPPGARTEAESPNSSGRFRDIRSVDVAAMCGGLAALLGLGSLMSGLAGRLNSPDLGVAPAPVLATVCLGLAVLVDATTAARPFVRVRRALAAVALLIACLGVLPVPTPMSLATGLSLALIGVALVGEAESEDPYLRAGAPLMAFLIGITLLVAEIYDSELTPPITTLLTQAELTALCLCLVSTGTLLARPQLGIVRLANADTVSGLILRRLIPPTLLAPIAVGALLTYAQRAKSLHLDMTMALFASTIAFFFAILILWTALIARAVDERRSASERQLAESEELFRAIFEQAAVGIAQVAPDGRLIRINAKFERILGYLPDELVGQTFQEITYAQDLPPDLANVERLLAGTLDTYSIEKRYVTKDGRITWASLTVALVRTPAGEPKYFVSVIEDINARKKAELELLNLKSDLERRVEERSKELLRSNTRFLGIMNSMSDVIVACDPNQAIIVMNTAFQRWMRELNGVDVKIGDTVTSAFASRPETMDRVGQLIKRGLTEEFSAAIPMTSIDGKAWTFDMTANILRDDLGNPAGAVFAAREVTEKLRDAKALADAKVEAERASQAKSTFLANVSHELRTPLGVIMGYSDLLIRPELANEDRIDGARIIRRNTDSLLAVVNDLLDLSKAEAKQITIKPVRFEVIELIFEVVESMRIQTAARGLSLVWVVNGRIPDSINSDPDRLRQILLNLLSNAVKFTDRGGVELSLHCQEDTLAFRIKDTGIGIAPEDQEKLFLPFIQAGSALGIKRSGTGLGLSLARTLAQALGGDARLVESTLGQGSTFEVSISTNLQTEARPLEAPQRIDASREEEAEAGPTTDLSDASVLLVEDMPDNQVLFRKLLEDAGAHVSAASTGEDALTAIEHGLTPDLVLMDVQMPGMGGHAATRELRRRGFARPIVALTAHAMQEERDRCLASGFTDFLAKPIHRGPLLAAVGRHVRGRQSREAPKA